MSTNTDLAKIFHTMATILEIKDENVFKINAHTKVARVLADLVDDVGEIDDLTSIGGIGKSSAKKINQYLQTGVMQDYDELIDSIPRGLLDVIKVQGLGPKTVRLLWKDAGVIDLPSFRKAIDDGKLDDLPRMGKKTIQNITESLVFLESGAGRLRIGVAQPIAETWIKELKKLDGVTEIEYAGSLRRGKETIGDIDILASTTDPETLANTFCTMQNVAKVQSRGSTKCSVRLESGLQVDLRIVDREVFGAALLYFTGSKEHNVMLRERAIKQNKRLNEYGLFTKDETCIAATTEEAIYEALALPWIPPECREDRGELECTETPILITMQDIHCDLHCHTTASDGNMSIETLAKQAIARGYHTIAVTDHSQSSTLANGLKPDRLLKHIDAIHEVNESMKEITILAGSEVDIHPDGHLDYDDELLELLDIVIASPHSALGQSSDVATKRLVAAIEHPLVHIIGHPTGRIINQRKGLEPDMQTVVDAASENLTALEVNANQYRLDLRDVHVRAAVRSNTMISVNTDAHHQVDFDQLQYGIHTARRGWLPPELCINCMSHDNLRAWLRRTP